MNILQSPEWESFQKSLGRKTWRVNNTLIIKHNLMLGKNYLYCYSPDINNNFKIFINKIKQIAKKEKSIFFKIELNNNINIKNFKFKKSNKNLQPLKTIILDINKPEQELLDNMRSKTRYNIKLAQKKNIIIKQDNKYIYYFIKLLKKTAKRDNFFLHEDDYYIKMLKNKKIKLFLAKYKNKIIAANLIAFFGDQAIYMHGASDYKYRKLMAPYLLQWQAILAAKKYGLKYYDFWGIDEKKWPGITRFKHGFGGKEVIYPGAFDLVFRPVWYRIYNIARKIL